MLVDYHGNVKNTPLEDTVLYIGGVAKVIAGF